MFQMSLFFFPGNLIPCFAGFFGVASTSCWCQIWSHRHWTSAPSTRKIQPAEFSVPYAYWWIYTYYKRGGGNLLYTSQKSPWYMILLLNLSMTLELISYLMSC